MEPFHYKVLIPTSGIGGPLGDITQYTNKSLIKVGKKPTLSYILEAYSPDTEFIVTVGHYAQQVRDFIKLAYPHLHVTLVPVEPYQGPGSSLGYSMLQAKSYLSGPFIYHASDTILLDPIPPPSRNWLGGFKSRDSSHYASFDFIEEKTSMIYEKGKFNSDFLYVGVAGIHDEKAFWEILQALYKENPKNETLGDVLVMNQMIQRGMSFESYEFKQWYDVGNVDSLNKVRKEIPDSFHILDKSEESIFVFDDFVIKFFFDESLVKDRVKRAHFLKGITPEIQGSAPNFYRYRYVHGKLFSKVATPKTFREFLIWAKAHLWKPVSGVSPQQFKEVCFDFYNKKTLSRVERFLSSRGIHDTPTLINDDEVPSFADLFKKINFDSLCASNPTSFHGDFILDNIIKTENGFCLLDWRQNFGGLLEAGDCYYDLAKLNHNLTVNHGIINDNLFTVSIQKNNVQLDILRKENLVECQDILFEFFHAQGYDIAKVKLLTALIWLNMSPLHHHPFDLFLFYFGKYHLWKALSS